MLDLPEPEDGFEEKLLHDIREYGWHWIQVATEHHSDHADLTSSLEPGPVHEATFVYTVGLWLSWGHPELILVGRWDHAQGVVATAVSLIEESARFAADDVSDEIVERYPVRFGAVSRRRVGELLTYASWVNGRHFDALQLLLPDSSGSWPGDAGYSSRSQPLLSD